MKHLPYIAAATALLLVPALAFGQEATLTGNATASTTVQTQKPPRPPVPKLGPAIKQTIEDSRENIKNLASTTREVVKDRVDEVHMLIDKRKAEVQALLERKPKGPMASTTMTQLEQKREEMRTKLETKKDEIKDRIQAAKQKAAEKFGEGVQRSVGNIVDHLTKAVGDLTSIAGRIDARIKELQGQGKDMSVSVGLLTTARTDIATAQDKITAVGSILTTTLSTTTPKAEMLKVREAVKGAEDALKRSKESLHKALESVRIEAAATTTATI